MGPHLGTGLHACFFVDEMPFVHEIYYIRPNPWIVPMFNTTFFDGGMLVADAQKFSFPIQPCLFYITVFRG